jgi:nucleotide-binding universal stress UspA family protein
MVKKILVATDGSPRSEKAADAAIMLAQSCGAELQVLSVYDMGSPRSAMDIDPDSYEEIKEDDMLISEEVEAERVKPEKQFVHQVTKKAAAASLQTQGIVRVGNPAEEILSTSKENACDMIVVGTHGRGPVATAVMGSIATQVIHTSAIPVLVVPMAG